MNLEKSITEAIANQLVTGRKYQTEYGEQTEEAQLTPIIRKYFNDNQEQILEGVIKQLGKKEVMESVVTGIVKHLSSDNWNNYKWKEFIKETSPLVADKVAKQMYDAHKKDICE